MIYKGTRPEKSKYEVRAYKDEDYLPARSIIRNAFHKMQVGIGLEAEDYAYLPNQEERRDFEENQENIFLLIDEKQIVGVLRLCENEIDDLAVAPEEQRKGYGTQLLHFAINHLLDKLGSRSIRLWCIVGNTARDIYLKEGFESLRTHDIMYKSLN